MTTPPPLGGWTSTYEWDPCSGGHPGPRSVDDEGVLRCNRCGRAIDLTPCGCGEPGHEGVSRSYCPVMSSRDRSEIRRRERRANKNFCPHDELWSDPCDECAYAAGDDTAARTTDPEETR
jgi:hypothetical protein